MIETFKDARVYGKDWTMFSQHLPPENTLVETKLHDEDGLRMERNLKRRGNFFYDQHNRLATHKPTHWKYSEGLNQ